MNMQHQDNLMGCAAWAIIAFVVSAAIALTIILWKAAL